MNAYDVLETRSRDNNFCRSILHFMVNHPLEKYSQVRLLNIEECLQELKEIAKQLTDLMKLLPKMGNDDNETVSVEFENVLNIFMLHISSIFARNMVEMLICLSFNIEPHITFWENQCKLNKKENEYRLYDNLNKIYSLSISWRRARIFKKLLSDLYGQIGHIQCWFWALIKLKNEHQSNNHNNIIEFISEMNELFAPNNANNANNANDDETERNIIDSMIESISFADSFVIKMQRDIRIWGMPSHWTRNYKIYASAVCVSVMFASILSYYNIDINHIKLPIFSNIFSIFNDLKLKYSKSYESECTTSYATEQKILKEMVASFESKHGEKSIIEQYKADIQSPILSATKGSLLSNIFIQIQQIKVELSQLVMMHSKQINTQILAFFPLIASVYLSHHIWCNKNDQNKEKKESTKQLRFLFRSIHSVLLKHYNEQYVEYEQCGLMLSLMYKCCVWAQNNLKNKLLSIDEYQWLTFDINHFISKEFSIPQKESLLKRMEIYYL